MGEPHPTLKRDEIPFAVALGPSASSCSSSLLLVMMLLGLFCLSGPSWAEAAFPEGEPQQSYTGSLLITAKEGDADSQSGVNPLATFEGDGGTVKLDHIGSGILRWQVLPDKIANDPFSFAETIYLYKVVSGKQKSVDCYPTNGSRIAFTGISGQIDTHVRKGTYVVRWVGAASVIYGVHEQLPV